MTEGLPEQPQRSTETGPSFENLGFFTTQDQTEELDFKKLLGEPLFNRSFYLSADSRDGAFGKTVIDIAVPFNGIKGREYEETRVLKEESAEAIMRELGVEPIPLDEFRYLFSQLDREQLAKDFSSLGSVETDFFVKFDDGKVRLLRASFSWGEGPHGYSVEVEELDAERLNKLKGAKIIAPKHQPESATATSGVEAYEALVTKGEWTAETEATLDSLIEKHEEDLYMLFLNYRESGLVDELPDHERRMYEWLVEKFG
jgi:hypothetical protein